MPPAPAALPAAVLFDMDGTVVDTEPYWIAAETDLVAAYGGTWTHDDGMLLVGRALLDSAAILIEHSPVTLTPEQVVDRLVAGVGARLAEQVPWRPGALELLRELRALGVPTALVTMSYRSLTDLLEAALPEPLFDVVVTGDEVSRGKPDPEPYLRAAELLDADPAACVAIEDSETGVRSAVAAGCRTLAVPHVLPVSANAGAVHVPSLAGVAAADLLTLA
ncbi:MAG TPA: HAD family phosphatase [Dermatophilaceae bacterium]|nr:HAD family phosphatase [Dermatophilaceae bacterium]